MIIEHKNYKLIIDQDQDPENPREWDNISKLVLSHNRYNFPNELNINFSEFTSWEEVKDHLIKTYKPIEIVPIYLYDHSGLWIKIGDFYNEPLPQGHAYFDSGQIGFALITKEDIIKSGLKPTKKLARSILEEEVKTYAKYVSGEVYTYRLVKIVKCNLYHEHEEDIDSCSGFYNIADMFNNLDAKPELIKKLKEAYKKGDCHD